MLEQRRRISFLYKIHFSLFLSWFIVAFIYGISLFFKVNFFVENIVYTIILIIGISSIALFIYIVIYGVLLMLFDRILIIKELVVSLLLTIIISSVTILYGVLNTLYKGGLHFG